MSHNLPICFFINSCYGNGPYSLLGLCDKATVANKLGRREYMTRDILSKFYIGKLAQSHIYNAIERIQRKSYKVLSMVKRKIYFTFFFCMLTNL